MQNACELCFWHSLAHICSARKLSTSVSVVHRPHVGGELGHHGAAGHSPSLRLSLRRKAVQVLLALHVRGSLGEEWSGEGLQCKTCCSYVKYNYRGKDAVESEAPC